MRKAPRARVLLARLLLQVCDGATDEERKDWDLLEAKEFKYLNKSSSYSLTGVDNAEEYRVRRHPAVCGDTRPPTRNVF